MVVGFKKSELLTKSPSPKSIPTTYALEGTFQAGHATGLHTGSGKTVVHVSEQVVSTSIRDDTL